MPVNALPPPVIIEEALVDGRAAVRGVMNHFPPGSGAFEFHFAAITLLDPRKAQHRYRLEGFDAGWVEAGTRRSAYYTNMKPGRYRFRVQGSNADGVWNEAGDALELTLAPHVYQTWWFFALAGLGALAGAAGVHRLRLQKVRDRYAAIYSERTRVARELHDSLLQGMTAALMHLRGLRKRFAPEAAAAPPATVAGEIKAVEDLVASNIEETRHFVWDLRERGGAPPPALPAALEDLAAPLGDRLEIAVTVEGRPVPLSRHAQRELLRIAHEALTNVVKHAQARRVEVRLAYDERTLTLSIRDDGRGFDPQAAAGISTGHFGLAGIRERASLLGQLQLDAQPGRGTEVTVMVDLEEHRDA